MATFNCPTVVIGSSRILCEVQSWPENASGISTPAVADGAQSSLVAEHGGENENQF